MLFKIFNSLEKLASCKQREAQAIGEIEKVASTFLSSLAKGLSKARRAAAVKGRLNYLKNFGLTLDKSGKMVAMSGSKLSDKLAAQQKALLDTQRIGIADMSKWSDEMKQLHSAYLKAGRDAKQAFMDKHGLTTQMKEVGKDAKGEAIYSRSIVSNDNAKLSKSKKALQDQYMGQLERNKVVSDEVRKLNAKGAKNVTAKEINDIVKRYGLNQSNRKGAWDSLMSGGDALKVTHGKLSNVYPKTPKPKPGPNPPSPEPGPGPTPEPPTPGPQPPPPGPKPPTPEPPTPGPGPAPEPPIPPKPPTPPSPPSPGPEPPAPGPGPDVPPGGGAGDRISITNTNNTSQMWNNNNKYIFNGGDSYINRGTMINGDGNIVGRTIGSGNIDIPGPAPITKTVTPPKPTTKTPEPKKIAEPEPTPAPVDAPIGQNLFNNKWWKYGLTGAGGFLLGRATDSDPKPAPYVMYNGMYY